MATANLDITTLVENQAGAEVIVNDALRRLDVITQLAVEDRDESDSDNVTPSNGEAWLVAASATNDWSGQEGDIAFYYDGWIFWTPLAGTRLWVKDEGVPLVYDGTSWNEIEYIQEATIADDAVHSFTPPHNFGAMMIHDGSDEVGYLLYDIANGAITEVADLNGNIATSTSSLSGTTGTDGQLTVAADSANGQIDIENRLGGSRTVRFSVKG